MIYISGTPAEIAEFLKTNPTTNSGVSQTIKNAKSYYTPVPANPIREQALALEAKNKKAIDKLRKNPTIAFKQMIVNRMAANAGIKDYWSKRLADAQFFDNWLNGVAITTSSTPITKNIISKTQTRFNSDKNAARAFLRAERKKITKTLNNELCKAWDKENRTMDKDVTTYPKHSDVRVWHMLDFAFDWLKKNVKANTPKASGIGSGHVNAAKANGSI